MTLADRLEARADATTAAALECLVAHDGECPQCDATCPDDEDRTVWMAQHAIDCSALRQECAE